MLTVGAHIMPNGLRDSQNREQISALRGADSDTAGHPQKAYGLPPEIYSHFIEHIDDRPTLLSLLVSSKSVHSQAERKLYRSIGPLKPTSHELFLLTILDPKSPHLARLVRRYSLSRAPVVDDQFCTLLTRALITLVNLKYLSFRGIYGTLSARVLPVGTPPPFQLHTFHWTKGTDAPLLGPFLDAQPSLKDLWLRPDNDLVTVLPTSLQRLRTLAGSTNIITAIVPGRKNITYLEWSTPSLPIPPIDAGLVSSFSHIRILSLGLRGARPSLGAVIALLEHLEVLELGTLHNRLQATELVHLYKLMRLHTLVVSNNRRGYSFPINPPDVFDQMVSLERIDWGHVSSMPRSYMRWVRGAQGPIEVDAFDVFWWSEPSVM